MGIGIFCMILGILMVTLGISQHSSEFIVFGIILLIGGLIFISKSILNSKTKDDSDKNL